MKLLILILAVIAVALAPACKADRPFHEDKIMELFRSQGVEVASIEAGLVEAGALYYYVNSAVNQNGSKRFTVIIIQNEAGGWLPPRIVKSEQLNPASQP